MPSITVGKENSGNVDLHYEDHPWDKTGCPYSRISAER